MLTFAPSYARVDADARFFRAQFPRARRQWPSKRHIVIGDSMGNRVGLHVRRCLGFAVLLSLFVSGGALAAWEWNFQAPATPIAVDIINLHNLIFWICVVIFIGVFGTMFWSLYYHRKSIGHQAVQFHENTTVEIIWTVIPFLILLFMLYRSFRGHFDAEHHFGFEAAAWYWHFVDVVWLLLFVLVYWM